MSLARSSQIEDFAEAVRDFIGAALVEGAGIDITVNDAGDTITIASTVPVYTDEQVRDVIGAALIEGAGIDITVNDAGDTITIASTITQYTDEQVRDIIGAALVQGAGITITVNDAGDTITVAAAAKHTILPFSYTGVILVGAGTFRLYAERTLTITAVRATLATAPTGANAIIDVNKNGTTIFTNQANRPTIAAGTNTALASGIDVTSLTAGDYLTVDIDQIGSTVAGEDLTVTVEVAE